MKTIWQASVESRNFYFEAYGTTAVEAMKALKVGLERHAEQYKLSKTWFKDDEITLIEYELNVPYRDCSEIK